MKEIKIPLFYEGKAKLCCQMCPIGCSILLVMIEKLKLRIDQKLISYRKSITVSITALTENSPLLFNLIARRGFSLVSLGSLSSKKNEFKISISFR